MAANLFSSCLVLFILLPIEVVYTRKSIPYHKFECHRDFESCVPSFVTAKKRPGNKCASVTDCYTTNNKCQNGYCRGLPLKAKCNSSLECDVGLYCSNNICVKTQLKSQYCDRDIHCASYLLCINNRCEEYGVMETGSVIAARISQPDFAQFACKSGYAVTSGKDMICSDGYVRISDMICTYDQTRCIYNSANGQLLYNISCVCGCSMFQMGYCPPGTGNDEYIKNFREMVEFSRLGRACHVYYNKEDKTDIPLFCDLARSDVSGYDSYLAFLELDNVTFVRIQDNNQSVRDKANDYYWRYNAAFQKVIQWNSLMLVIIAIICL